MDIPAPSWFKPSGNATVNTYHIDDYGLFVARCKEYQDGSFSCDLYAESEPSKKEEVGVIYSSGNKYFVCSYPDLIVYSGYENPKYVVKNGSLKPLESLDEIRDADMVCVEE